MNKSIEILLQNYISNENDIDEGERLLRAKEKQLRELNEGINNVLTTNKDIKEQINKLGNFDELMTEYKNKD